MNPAETQPTQPVADSSPSITTAGCASPTLGEMNELAWRIASAVGFCSEYEFLDCDINYLTSKGKEWRAKIELMRNNQTT